MKVIKSESLSKEYEPRYICIDEETGEVLDDAQGYGFKSPQKAHACYAFKNKTASQKDEENRKINIITNFLTNKISKIRGNIEDILFYGFKDGLSDKEVNQEIYQYLDTIGFDFKTNNISKKFFLKHIENN